MQSLYAEAKAHMLSDLNSEITCVHGRVARRPTNRIATNDDLEVGSVQLSGTLSAPSNLMAEYGMLCPSLVTTG